MCQRPNYSKIIELASLKMDAVQNQRLGELQAKGKNTGLTEAEGYELSVLISIYQMGQLRKSMALAEAVKRGLREPTPATVGLDSINSKSPN
jgi:hypothetical protein